MTSFFSNTAKHPECRCHNSLTVRFIPLYSTNRAPVQSHLPLLQTYSSNKQEEQAVEETLKLELVRGARHSGAPQTNPHVNGDLLSVFDDSTLSEVSDDEGRYICSMPPICISFTSLSLTCVMLSD